MPNRTADNRVFHAGVKGAVIGLFASFSIRLPNTPLGILIWMGCAVVLGAIASVLYEVVFGGEDTEENADLQDSHIPLVVTATQVKQSEKILLEVPDVGKVEIALQPDWKDGGLLKLSGLLPDDEVVVARLCVMDE